MVVAALALHAEDPASAQVVSGTPVACVPVAENRDHRTYRTQQTLVVVDDGTAHGKVYVGVEYKGVYMSDNGGASWTRRSDGLKGYSMSGAQTMPCIQEMGRIVADPGDSQHLYLTRVETPGTATMPFSELAGIYETRNGGVSWQQLSGYNNYSGSKALAVRWSGSAVHVYMGTSNMPASHMPGSTVTYNTNGILYRSLNGGSTWTEFDQREQAQGETTIPMGASAVQVFVSSDGQNIWFPSTARENSGQFLSNRQFGFMESTDGGTSWFRGTARLVPDVTYARLAVDADVAPQLFSHRFLSATNPTGSSVAWYTRDGETWAMSGRYMYVARYSPHDSNADTLYGYDPFAGERTADQQGIYKSTDGGSSWSRISPLPAEVGLYVYPEVRLSHFAFHPTNANVIYASGNMALVYKSEDAGLTWTKVMDLSTIGGANVPCGTCQAPGTPGSFRLEVSGQTVTGSWTPATEGGPPSRYVVEMSRSQGFASVAQRIETTSQTFTLPISGTDLGVSLYFRVTAENQWGTSVPSPSQVVMVGGGGATGGGGTGGGSTGGGGGTTGVSLSPSALTAPAAGGALSVSLTTTSSSATWTATSTVPWLTVSPATGTGSATLSVTAQVLPGVETRSGSIQVGNATVTVSQSPTADKPAALTVASVDGAMVTLRWLWPGARPDSYVLKGGLAPGETMAQISTSSNDPTFTFTAPQGAFYVRIVGQRGGNELVASDDVRISVQVPEAPSAPRGLSGVAKGSELQLTWVNTRSGGSPTNVTLDVSGSLVLSQPLGQATEQFTFSAVPNGTYHFSVRASNPAGTSVASNTVTLTFPGTCQAPSAPEAFQAYAVGNMVYLTWDPPSTGAATGYVVSVGGSYVGQLPVAGRTVSTPAPAGSYTLSVAATSICGTGAATAAQTVTVVP